MNFSNSNGSGAHLGDVVSTISSDSAEPSKRFIEVPEVVRRMGAPLLALQPGSKAPATTLGPNGLKDALPAEAFVLRKTPAQNYGIRLDHHLCVDIASYTFDADPVMTERYSELITLKTLHVRTGGTHHGEHFIFTVPMPLVAKGKVEIKAAAAGSKGYGEFLFGAGHYIVGAGSVAESEYEMLCANDPVEAPQWVLDWIRADAQVKLSDLGNGGGVDAIPAGNGNHRRAALKITKCLREMGLTAKAATERFADLGKSGLFDGYDADDPFAYTEILKMAQGIATGSLSSGALADAFVPALLLDFTDEQSEVFVEGMVWRGQLHVLYGDGGIGKTGAACKLLADITRKGYDVAFIASEDRPQDVVKRIIASKGDPKRIHVFNEQAFGRIVLPDAEDALHEFLLSANLGCLYFDSVMDHRKTDTKRNAADDARDWAGPLHRLALATKTAIITTCHLNANHELEGARQIRNKARSVLRLTRVKAGATYTSSAGERIGPFAEGSALIAKAEKTNRAAPGSEIIFGFVPVPSVNPLTGVTDIEKREDGSMGEGALFVCDRIERLKPGFKLPAETKSSQAKRENHDALAERRLALFDWFGEHPGRQPTDAIIASGIVTKNNVAVTVNDPMFKRTMEKGTKYTEQAERAA